MKDWFMYLKDSNLDTCFIVASTGFHFLFKNDELKKNILRHIVLINQPLVIVVSHKIIVHNLELIINNNIF